MRGINHLPFDLFFLCSFSRASCVTAGMISLETSSIDSFSYFLPSKIRILIVSMMWYSLPESKIGSLMRFSWVAFFLLNQVIFLRISLVIVTEILIIQSKTCKNEESSPQISGDIVSFHKRVCQPTFFS